MARCSAFVPPMTRSKARSVDSLRSTRSARKARATGAFSVGPLAKSRHVLSPLGIDVQRDQHAVFVEELRVEELRHEVKLAQRARGEGMTTGGPFRKI